MIRNIKLGTDYRFVKDGDHAIVFVSHRKGEDVDYPYLLISKGNYEVIDEYKTLSSVECDLFDAIQSATWDILNCMNYGRADLRAEINSDNSYTLYVDGDDECTYIPYMTKTEHEKILKICDVFNVHVEESLRL